MVNVSSLLWTPMWPLSLSRDVCSLSVWTTTYYALLGWLVDWWVTCVEEPTMEVYCCFWSNVDWLLLVAFWESEFMIES